MISEQPTPFFGADVPECMFGLAIRVVALCS
jgi:hypothetical protein